MSRRTVFVALQQFCETDPKPLHVLSEAGCAVRQNTLGRRLRREEMVPLLREVDAVIAAVEPYDAELLAALPRLRLISRCGTGTDAIDLEAARRLGVTVTTTPDETVEPVAQMAVTMILALARNVPQHLAEFRAGRWVKHSGFLLSEWTVGIVGFGRIGRAVERYLRAFGPRILVADPALGERDVPDSVVRCSFPTLLAEADVITLHAGRDPKEGALIGSRELRMMKRGAYLVNTSRGFLVDEESLREALDTRHLAGAALDVFSQEPYVGPFTQSPHVLGTPHVATLTRASRAAMELRCAKNVVDFFSPRTQEAPCVRGSQSAASIQPEGQVDVPIVPRGVAS